MWLSKRYKIKNVLRGNMKMITSNMTTKFEYVLHIGNMIAVCRPHQKNGKCKFW